MRHVRLVGVGLALCCAPTYRHGCSTQPGDVVTRGAIEVRHFSNDYEAAAGRRQLRWCEITVAGKPLESSTGSRVAQGCDLSPDPQVEAVAFSWQLESGTTGATLLELTGGRQVDHVLRPGPGGWLAGGKLYATGTQIFDLVHHTEHALPQANLWQLDVAPDGTAISGHTPFEGPTVDFVVMQVGDGSVHKETLVRADHAWLNPGDGKPVPVKEHVHWAPTDAGFSLVFDP